MLKALKALVERHTTFNLVTDHAIQEFLTRGTYASRLRTYAVLCTDYVYWFFTSLFWRETLWDYQVS